jgi:hypothetical protein
VARKMYESGAFRPKEAYSMCDCSHTGLYAANGVPQSPAQTAIGEAAEAISPDPHSVVKHVRLTWPYNLSMRLRTGRERDVAEQTVSGVDVFPSDSVLLSCAVGEGTASGTATEVDFRTAYASQKARWTEVIDRLK